MVNNLDFLCHNLWCSVRVVDGLPRAGSHYNLGTSRGPDKNRVAGRTKSGRGPDPARGPRLAHGCSRRFIFTGSWSATHVLLSFVGSELPRGLGAYVSPYLYSAINVQCSCTKTNCKQIALP